MLILPTGRVNSSPISRSRFSLDGIRMPYLTPHPSEASSISGLAKAVSTWNTTSLPNFYSRSISGSRTSSQFSALWTLPGLSLAAVSPAMRD